MKAMLIIALTLTLSQHRGVGESFIHHTVGSLPGVGSSLDEVRERCPDIKSYTPDDRFYESQACLRLVNGTSLSFEFEGAVLRETTLLSYVKDSVVEDTLVNTIKKELTLKYGSPTGKHCIGVYCRQYHWSRGKRRAMLHRVDNKRVGAYGVFLLFN